MWQDDICLEPLTSVPGFSELCNACIRVFRDSWRDQWTPHLRYLNTLTTSARRGCRLCALLLDKIQEQDEDLNIGFWDVSTPFYKQIAFSSKAMGAEGQVQKSYLGLAMLRFRSLLGRDPRLIGSHEVPTVDSPTSNQILAKRWFQLCSSTHSRCRPKSCATNFPTRLLDLDACETHASIRVTVTDTSPREGEYMTLSHCWGAAQLIMLRTSNIEKLRQGIHLAELPRTFQDAVAVARWFKVRYLWIDSLCILQDCKEDWFKESAMMRDIYKHSTMNIAATGAADSSVGCFLDRNADILRPFNVVLSDSQSEELKYFCFDVQFWYTNIYDAPLSKRAWVCQERLLSPRVLHFGEHQMSWECMELASCETFPERIPEQLDVVTKRDYLNHQQDFSEDAWDNIVLYYTECSLTFPSDIYMAFAGLAEEIHSFTQDDYLAGLWRKGLARQLLWYVAGAASIKSPDYKAPSWSWLSVTGAVESSTFYNDSKVIFEVVDVHVEYSSENVWGPVSHGCLKGRGMLGPAVCQETAPHTWEFQSIRGRGVEDKESQEIAMDQSTGPSEHELVCLPVVDFENGEFSGQVIGLLLEPTHKEKDEYWRVGRFSIDGKYNRRRLLQQRRRNGTWGHIPKKSFSIV